MREHVSVWSDLSEVVFLGSSYLSQVASYLCSELVRASFLGPTALCKTVKIVKIVCLATLRKHVVVSFFETVEV